MIFDIIIIGAGISGTAAAYELSKYELNIALVEKENDVSLGATRANSAVLHAGFDARPGTLMAKYNAPGNALTKAYCRRNNVHMKECGSLVVAFFEEERAVLRELYDRGMENGVPDMRIVEKEELRAMEPNLSREAVAALLAPTAAIVDPWELCISLGENAVLNGVSFFPNFNVAGIEKEGGLFRVLCGEKSLCARVVLNAAGVHAEEVADYLGAADFTITPRKGEYYLLDKSAGGAFSRVMFMAPNKEGKGVLVAPTVHGNLIVGPNSQGVEDKEDVSATAWGQAAVAESARRLFPAFNPGESIRNFSGVRANSLENDFVIGKTAVPGFLNMAAMKSPGLTSALAVAGDIVLAAGEAGIPLKKKEHFTELPRPARFYELSREEKEALIKKDCSYGRMVCRCEGITEGEILNCFSRPIPPVSVDGVKRRTGAGLGRCQGGFCGARVQRLVQEALGIPLEEVPLDRAGSYILTGKTKEDIR